VVIPAILEWTGPVLATSVKPDVIKATRAHRERHGEVVVLDPLGASGLAGARWTPLASCRTWAGAQGTAPETPTASAIWERRPILSSDGPVGLGRSAQAGLWGKTSRLPGRPRLGRGAARLIG
jgi:type IV secretory system conjugative DNA transfer VirD4/TraG family protein